MNKALKKQLNYVYTYTFFAGAMFFFGIEQLFFEQIGDGNFARGVNLAVFSSAMLVATVPAGAIADIWGRVRSLRLGSVFLLVSLVILSLSENVFQYSVGAVLFALYIAFDEGAKEAFVYDMLIDNKLEDQYEKVLGRMYASLLIGAATANLASGFMAELTSLRFNYVASLIPACIALYFTLKLREPPHHKNEGKKMLRQFDDVFRELKIRRLLLLFTIAQAFVWTFSDVVQEFAQPVILEYTDSAIVLGVSWSILGVIMAVAFTQVHKVKRVFTSMSLILGLYLFYLVLRDTAFSLVPLALAVAGIYAIGIKGENALQVNAPSHLRATAVSVSASLGLILTLTSGIWIGESKGSVVFRVSVIAIPMLVVATMLYWRGRRSFEKGKV